VVDAEKQGGHMTRESNAQLGRIRDHVRGIMGGNQVESSILTSLSLVQIMHEVHEWLICCA